MIFLLEALILLMSVYTLRHYWFTLNRLFGVQKHPYVRIGVADWPTVTVLIAAHNEEKVIADILRALLKVDYPVEKLKIIPVNDRSSDRTREIIDNFAAHYPGRITPFHRTYGKPGKAAALKDAMAFVNTEVLLVFDADYVPGKSLIKSLAAPFFDPEVGSVMGRVIPSNVSGNFLTRLLDLERSGGYQVNQQARMNLGLVPQYGGTVGGIRKSALEEVGGWNENSLAEDTDLTFRLLLKNWKTVYQNGSECYEDVPESWPVRIRQIKRWAAGHNQALAAFLVPLLFQSGLKFRQRIDGLLLLCVYTMAPLILLGWLLAGYMFYAGLQNEGLIALLGLSSFTTVGNLAAFFEVAAAARLDGSRQRIRLLPLAFLAFAVSMVAVSRITLRQLFEPIWSSEFVWHKTERTRESVPELQEAA